ncbi:MAG: dihydropteroate synthase [Rhodoferax sp.]|nr:dihydropteroate synthase [Rhodoferax sp.]
MFWQTSRYRIDLGRPRVMGIVNITPDSFTDGGQYLDAAAALGRCEQLLSQGADLLDLGAESTRPGAQPLSAQEELIRLLPVLQGALQLGVPVSVDTYKPEVMQVALDMGADIINDIWALRWLDPEPSAAALSGLAVVAAHPNCGVCLMHMHREPQTMQASPMEGEVLTQVLSFLSQRALALAQRGVAKARIVLDPGIGFGKTAEQNFSLLAQQQALLNGGYPLLAGWSRKRSLASSLDLPSAAGTDMPHPRMVASVAAALLAVERGAAIVRVHDVRETVQALKVLSAIK